MANILVVEDDDLIAELIVRSLSNDGHDIKVSGDGDAGYRLARNGNFDLFILDIMLPNKSGLDICKELRNNDISTPILFLSARDSESSIVQGLDIGADDYLTKPFGYKELVARVSTLLRRKPITDLPELIVGNIELSPQSYTARVSGKEVGLRKKEFELLKYLIQRKNSVVAKEELMRVVWGVDISNSSNRLEACMKNLRKALGDEGRKSIQTVRNIGYKVVD